MKVPDDAVTAHLRQQMRDIRREMRGDIEDIASQARQLTDWRHYVRQAPWITSALAALVAYSIVPSPSQVKTLSKKDVEALAKKDQVILKSRNQSASNPGPFGILLRLAMAAAIRAGVGYVGHQVGVIFDKKKAPPSPPKGTADPVRSGKPR